MDKQKNQSDEQVSNNNENKQEPVVMHNPFPGGKDIEITQDDIENEQKFKEAMTERD